MQLNLIIPDKLVKSIKKYDQIMIQSSITHSLQAPITWSKTTIKALPPKVDYTALIPFIREQGGYGCGMYSGAACWDIQNESFCPYSPNLSVNRQLWGWSRELRKEAIPGIGVNYQSLTDYLINFGNPTEGTELTNSDAVQWPTDEGSYEAPNYRLSSPNTPVKVDINEFKTWLTKGPLRVSIWGNHFVALIGYDDNTQRFKFVNSWGDQWGENGYGYVSYSNLNKEIQSGEYLNIIPPKSIPSAKIRFSHTYRQSVYLWIGIENRPSAKRIWPNGQIQDISKNLTLTVTLPRGFVWPPGPGNRLCLDVYDCGVPYESGGELHEFTATFCGQTFPCAQLAKSPIHITPYQVSRIYIP